MLPYKWFQVPRLNWAGALTTSLLVVAFISSVAEASLMSTEEARQIYAEAMPPVEERRPSEQAARVIHQLVFETKESGICQGKTLTIQCFGNRDCLEAEVLTRIALEPFARSTGLRLRPIHRIWDSEALFYQIKNGERIPQNMKSVPISATMFYHTAPERSCATTLAMAVGIAARDIGTHERNQAIVPIEPVARNAGSPGFIEFWWSMLP